MLGNTSCYIENCPNRQSCELIPPAGLPQKSDAYRKFFEHRLADIYDAIVRYTEAGLAVPIDWIEEQSEINKALGH
jgi:hypothetical protein